MKMTFNRIFRLTALVVVVGLMASPALAGLVGGAGYGVHETTTETKTGKSYSGGLDLVYAQIATGPAAARTRSFLKCEDGDWTGGYGIQVNMYDYRGNFITTLADGINPYGSAAYSIYSQSVKVDPTPVAGTGDRVVWFSMTGGDADQGDWYTVTVDADFTTVVSGPTARFSQPGNWEVEWHPATGRAFYAGKESNAWTDPHAIYIRTGGALQKVVDVGGYSCGFAFDPAGNLYTGTYTDSGPATHQHVRMYTAAQVQAAISGGYALTAPGGAYPPQNVIAIPAPNGVYLGANDLESDPDGNIYLTANGAWDDTYNSDVGYVYRIDAWNPASPPAAMARIAAGTMTPDLTDWQKALAYDGGSSLAAGGHYDYTNPAAQAGNRLYVDQDFPWGEGGPDVVAGLSIAVDTDSDGVPDALDNAYLTANGDQRDTDQDMCGNMADADLNNDNVVSYADRSLFRQTYNKSTGDAGFNEDADFNGNGWVDSYDRSRFRARYNDYAPYY